MIYFFIFVAELLLLFLSSRLVTKSLFAFFYRLTRQEHLTVYITAILFFPGVVIHELAHALTAGVLMVPVGDIEFLPKLSHDGLKLGSVQFARTDPIRRALIGLAPILLGGALLLLVLWYYFSNIFSVADSQWWQHVLVGYILFELGNTMFSSKKDMEGFIPLAIVVVLLLGTLYFLGINWIEQAARFLNASQVNAFFEQITLLLLVPLGINAFFISLRVVPRIFNK